MYEQELKARSSISPTHRELAIRGFKCDMEIADILEVPRHYAQTEAVKNAKPVYNVDFSPLLLKAPAQDNIQDEEVMLEPLDFGKRVGLSAISFNRKLKALGYQIKEGERWVPTAIGKGLCSKHSWKKGSKTGYNLKWNVEPIIDALVDAGHVIYRQ